MGKGSNEIASYRIHQKREANLRQRQIIQNVVRQCINEEAVFVFKETVVNGYNSNRVTKRYPGKVIQAQPNVFLVEIRNKKNMYIKRSCNYEDILTQTLDITNKEGKSLIPQYEESSLKEAYDKTSSKEQIPKRPKKPFAERIRSGSIRYSLLSHLVSTTKTNVSKDQR